MYYESESIAVLQGTGAGRTLYEGGTDAVDYAAVFKPCNLTAGAGAWHALFEKKGRNVVLTRYGKMFLPYVEESLKVLNEGVQRIQEVNGSRHGIIHLAYIYTMGSEFAPKLVRKFLDAYPDYDIEFHFTVGTTGEIIDGLKDDKYDIVFSSYKDGEQDIDFKKIANQKLCLQCPWTIRFP